MPDDTRWGHVELDVQAGREPAVAIPDDETPFHILILGDFSGRGSRPAATAPVAVAQRRPRRVDRDDIDDVLAAFAPEVLCRGAAGDGLTIRIRTLDDFHPDRLFESLPLFESLRALRQRLSDPATAPGAVRELLGGDAEPGAAPRPAAPGHVLDAILGEPLDPPSGAASTDPLQDFIRRSVAPHLVAADDPRQAQVRGRVDTAITVAMRELLHQRAFQALESLWRGVAMLTRSLETGASLQVHLLDLSIPELVADVAAVHGPGGARSAVAQAVAAGADALDGASWALIVGAYTFGWDDADLLVLDHLAGIARRAGAPVVAGAVPRLAGARSFDRDTDPATWSPAVPPAWDAFRRSPNAPWVGLVAPRFLGRAPYGAAYEPCDTVAFEEVPPEPPPGDLLWINGALACARLLGQSFGTAGWRMRPGMDRELDGLPLVTVHGEGGAWLQPCAELLLTERAAGWMLERGIMPLASLKDRDAALLVRFQSVADPVRALAGPWAAAESS